MDMLIIITLSIVINYTSAGNYEILHQRNVVFYIKRAKIDSWNFPPDIADIEYTNDYLTNN